MVEDYPVGLAIEIVIDIKVLNKQKKYKWNELTLTPPNFLMASRRLRWLHSCLDCSSDPVSTPKNRRIFRVKYLKY